MSRKPRVRRPGPRRILPLGWALLAAAVAGAALTAAYPALSVWGLVFVAVPLALVSLIGRTTGSAFLVGLIFGAAFYLINVSFTARYLGPIPWLALSGLESVLTGLLAIPLTWAYRWFPAVLPQAWARMTLLPLLIAGLWTMREQVIGTWPYGGFPWARVGITQVSGPLAPVLSWVAISGLSMVIVWLSAAAIEFVRLGRWRAVQLVAFPALVAILAFTVPVFPTTQTGTMRVGAVQGDGPAGYFDRREPYGILNSQVAATAPLTGQQMDVLLWPEGSVDADPLRDAAAMSALDGVSESVSAPLLIGAVTQRDGQYHNSALLWQDGAATQVYDKIHPVPFGEYVPDRAFYTPLAPDLIGLIARDYQPGVRPPVMDVAGVRVGLAICFDVIYDDVSWAGSAGGAEIFLFQTNNADFRGTDENLQQLAFARARAIETGRSAVNLSTVGASQVIAADGSTLDALAPDTAGAMLTDVPLRTGTTPAVSAGPVLAWIWGWGSLIALGLLWGARTLMNAVRRSSAGVEPDATR